MQIKVVSWNIWQGNHLAKIISYLQRADADVIGIQEVIEKDGTNTAALIAGKLGYHFEYARATETTRLGFPQGNAILSKWPIAYGTHHFISDAIFTGDAETEPRVAVEAKIDFSGVIVNFFTTHLAYSHKFSNSEIRNNQVNTLLRLLPQENVVVMGDFNSPPQSKYMAQLHQALVNTDPGMKAPTWTKYPFEYQTSPSPRLHFYIKRYYNRKFWGWRI